MENQPSGRNAMVVVAFTAVTVAAWAANESLSNSTWVPYIPPSGVAAPVETPTGHGATRAQPGITPTDPTVAQAEPLPLRETLSPNETVVKPVETPVAPAVPRRTAVPRKTVSAQQTFRHPPIVVQGRRLSLDERIRADVMDRIAATPNLSGKIGVESRGAVVRLSGYTATAGQASRAGRAAAGVDGVRSVRNEIRPRIGGSV